MTSTMPLCGPAAPLAGFLACVAATPLVSAPPDPHCCAIVIVPARDEAPGIAATLEALARQQDANGAPLDPRCYEIILLANNCADTTAAVARAFAAERPAVALHVVERTFPASEANVGTARRLLMDEAYRRLTLLERPRGIIVSTDADTRPEPTWLAATLAEIAGGADAVGGRIRTDAGERALLAKGARHSHLCDVGYRMLMAEVEALIDPVSHDPWPHHFQHFGASFALTAEAYKAVGGLPQLPALEDVALSVALVLADARFRHSPMVRVVTSARTVARNVRGFSTQLQEWEALRAARTPFLVESAASIVTRARQRHALRQLWGAARVGLAVDAAAVATLARALGISACWLSAQFAVSQPFGVVELRVARRQGKRLPFDALGSSQPIAAATHDLRAAVAALRGSALAPREEIEPIRLRALAPEVIEEATVVVQEFLVDLVAGQRRVIDDRGPVNQQELAAAD
jgi:hypothetical protein